MKTAAVFGAGPTGLLAAHWLIEKGYKTRIFTAKLPAQPRGAFYFHALPNRVKEKNGYLYPRYIFYRYLGTAYEYTMKQWGIEYNSSFGKVEDPTGIARELGWWPTERIWGEVMSGLDITIKEFTPRETKDACGSYDFSVITYPLEHKPFIYHTPVARVPVEAIKAILPDYYPMSGEILYDGLNPEKGYHREIVRIIAPPEEMAQGYCWVELTRNASLPAVSWTHWTSSVPDIHPYQPLLTPAYDFPDNVLLAGRFATGNTKYLSSDVLMDLEKRLG